MTVGLYAYSGYGWAKIQGLQKRRKNLVQLISEVAIQLIMRQKMGIWWSLFLAL